MNIYKLKNAELNELSGEFNSTAFGRRTMFFCKVSVLFSVTILFVGVLLFVLATFEVEAFSHEFSLLLMGLGLLSFSFTAITQLMYASFLKDYANSKK